MYTIIIILYSTVHYKDDVIDYNESDYNITLNNNNATQHIIVSHITMQNSIT